MMRRNLVLFCIICFAAFTAIGQEEETEKKKKRRDRPVAEPWNSTILIDRQTSVTPEKGILEYVIHHRFGKIEELSDLFGLYAPSNIRMGFNYGITDKIMVGIGTEKNNKLQDIQWKYQILQQTRKGTIPLALTYYGNLAIDAREDENFGQEYKFTHRLSYFHELIVSRKFTDRISALAAINFSHFNQVDTAMNNDVIGLTYGGKARVYNNISFLFEGNYPITKHDINPQKQSMNFGVEFATITHCFQVFAASFREIVPQKNFVYNQNDLYEGDWFLGFNITVRF